MYEKEIKFTKWEQEKIKLLADALENYRSEFITHMKDPEFFSNGGKRDELMKSFNDLTSQYKIPTGPWFVKLMTDNSSVIAASLSSKPLKKSTDNFSNVEKLLIILDQDIVKDPLFRLLSLSEFWHNTLPKEISIILDAKKIAKQLLSYENDDLSISQKQEIGWWEKEFTQDELIKGLGEYNKDPDLQKDEKYHLWKLWENIILVNKKYGFVHLIDLKESTIRNAISTLEDMKAEHLKKRSNDKKKKKKD